jgi:sugar lactone lactonase YvrE
MKTRLQSNAFKHSHRLAFLACIIGAQLNFFWFSGEGLAMSMSMHRAPFHKSGILPTFWEGPAWRTLAGCPGQTGTNDGPGVSARFSYPSGIAVDAAGIIYVADSGNNVIRKINPAGLVSTVAGKPGQWGWEDGSVTNALFYYSPGTMALDADGNLYVADGCAIRKLSTAGVVSTIAGQSGVRGYSNGVGTNALFGYGVGGLALDQSGDLYVADSENYVVRKVSPAGVVSTVAGQAGVYGHLDDVGTNALFRYIGGLAIDTNGNVYVADSDNSLIRKISPAGLVTTWVGQPGKQGYRDGQGTNAWFVSPSGLAIDRQGNIYVTETGNRCVRKISPEGEVSTLGGDAWLSVHRDGLGPFATFVSPCAAALDSSGHLLVVDSSTIRYGSLGPEPQPRILSQPRNETVPEGANVTFSVIAQGAAPLTYQWMVNGNVLAGATNTSLALPSVQEADAGEYRVAVSDGVGYVWSFPASLRVRRTQAASPAPWDNWHPLASLPLRDIHGLARGHGRYVAIGEGDWYGLGGSIANTTDGEHWVKQIPITSENLNSVAFGNGLFVVVGNNGTVLTSTNGLAWEAQTLTAEGLPNLRGIAFARGLFVVVSGDANGSIWTSPDGIDWTNRGMDFGVSFMAVMAQGDQFIALGNTIMVSTNGTDWEPAEVPASYLGEEILLEHIAWANGTFLAAQHWGGALATSSTGLEWRDVTPTNELSLSRVTGGNGRFFAVDSNSGGIRVSTDGMAWTAPAVINSGGRTCAQPHLCFEGGLFVATGVATGEWSAVFTSSDGNSWRFSEQEKAIPFVPGTIIAPEGRYFGVAGGIASFGVEGIGIATSSNGSDWTVLLPTNNFDCIAYGGGILVAIGGEEQIVSSPDNGATWTDRSPHLSYGTSTPYLSRMTCGGGVFVAIGGLNDTNRIERGHILASSNLVNWIATDFAPTNSLSDVAYGDGLFVTLLNRSRTEADILTSMNGWSWNTAASFPTIELRSVAYGHGRFVVGTSAGTVITSPDGITWKEQAVAGVYYFSRVFFGNGVFLAWANGTLWISADGVAWKECAIPPVSYFQSVGVGEGTFLVLGDDSVLYQSGPIERVGSPRWLPNLDLEWTVTGAPHLNYRIEFSEDLLDWRTLTHLTNAPATSPFTDPDASTRPSRFYRVMTE